MLTKPVTTETLADLLETLVNIPSETGHEAAIAEWTMKRLTAIPFGERYRSGNAIVWRGPQGGATSAKGTSSDRPLVILAGHLDTVPARGNQQARRVDGRLYGLGSTDMKAGDAVMLALLETIDAATLRFDLAAVFYDAEEGPHEHNGLMRLLREMPWLSQASLAILLEPTDLKVELGCNGVMNAEVKVTGKSGHSARPWTGINAVERAAPWLAEITRFPSTKVEVGGAEFVETLQVTTVSGGRARNVIPDELMVNLNYRFPPDRTIADAERKLRSLVPADFEVKVVDRAAPGLVCTDRVEVREFIDRFRVEARGKQGWTDVAQFTAAGVPAFNFGPGIPELCHQVDEYCPIDNLEVAYRWLREFVTEEQS